jgi:AAA domain-containing protein
MARLNGLALAEVAGPKESPGEDYVRTVLSHWTGSHVADACIAATNLGLIHSGGALGYYRVRDILLEEFELRKVDDVNWSVVDQAFQNGRSAVISTNELKDRFSRAHANDNNTKPLQLPNQVKADLKPRFQVTWFDDVDKTPAKEHVLKDVIGAGEFSLWVAKPGTAKSVLLCDIGCHIAAGRDWHGRKVQRGLVVFFAAERKSLTERRIAAWRKHHGVFGIPFAVVGGKLDMTSGLIDARALAATVKACEEKSGIPCRLVILDTVTRTFGPGDQNSSKDMTRFVQAVDQLTLATGAHVAAIHHSGWAGDRGKGAVDLDGAVDVSYGVGVVGKGPTKVFTLECTGANDGEEGVITSFRLDSVQLGMDADGNVTDAPVVVQVDGTKHDGSNLKGNTGKALDSLKRAIQEHGETPPDGSPGFPDGVVTVGREEWRLEFYRAARAEEADIKDDALKRRFNRAVLDLTTTKQIEMMGEWFWLAGQN